MDQLTINSRDNRKVKYIGNKARLKSLKFDEYMQWYECTHGFKLPDIWCVGFWINSVNLHLTAKRNTKTFSFSLIEKHKIQSRGPEKAHQNNGDRRGHIADFRNNFERVNWLVFLFKCGVKNENPFWMASLTPIFTRSVELRTYEAVRPSGMESANWPPEDQCQRNQAHCFLS